MDDDYDVNDEFDLDIETFSSIEKSNENIDQYFTNSDLKPFNSGDNNIYSNAGLNEVFNTTIENWSSNNNYFKSNDYSLLDGNNPNTPLANEYGTNSNYLNIK